MLRPREASREPTPVGDITAARLRSCCDITRKQIIVGDPFRLVRDRAEASAQVLEALRARFGELTERVLDASRRIDEGAAPASGTGHVGGAAGAEVLLQTRRQLDGAETLLADLVHSLQSMGATLADTKKELERSSDLFEKSEAQRAFYSGAFGGAPCPLFVTTRAGIVREANDAAAIALRVPRTFFVDRPLVGFVARSDCMEFRRLLGSVARGDVSGPLKLRARHGGGVFAVRMNARLGTTGQVVWHAHAQEGSMTPAAV